MLIVANQPDLISDLNHLAVETASTQRGWGEGGDRLSG
jgi:hypothetical protein